LTEQFYPYRPDYAVPPGWVIEERIEAQGISPGELADSCGLAPELVADIIAGESTIDTDTAAKLEEALGLDASIWLGIEADFRASLSIPQS